MFSEVSHSQVAILFQDKLIVCASILKWQFLAVKPSVFRLVYSKKCNSRSRACLKRNLAAQFTLPELAWLSSLANVQFQQQEMVVK